MGGDASLVSDTARGVIGGTVYANVAVPGIDDFHRHGPIDIDAECFLIDRCLGEGPKPTTSPSPSLMFSVQKRTAHFGSVCGARLLMALVKWR